MSTVSRRALHRAIDADEGQLVLLYQPIHDLGSRKIRAAEALLRQRRATGEIREASMIAEAAEESTGPELYVLDNIIVKRAYTDAARWQAEFPDVHLNVNLSPREFQEGNVIERLTTLVTSCGVDTSRVNLEITETTYIEHPKETMKVLEAIDELGVGLWLDDFGTGHSSLTHLQHFTMLEGIKLPGAFVKDIPRDKRCTAIVRAVIALAHDLGLEVIAEGVEREEQLEFLRELRCQSVQGFLFSRPMSADAFHAKLAGM